MGFAGLKWGGAELAPPLGKRTSGLPTSALSRTEICFERQLIIRYLCDHRSATTTPVLIAHHLPLWVCDPRAGLEAADAPARCLIRSRVVGSALVLSSVSLFDLRPFLRSLIAATNASTFFLVDTSRSLLACLGSFFCSTSPQAFFCPDRRFPTPTRAAAVKDGPSSGHRFGGAQRP